MKRLNKKQAARLEDLGTNLQTIVSTLDEGIDAYNEVLETAWDTFQATMDSAWGEHITDATDDLASVMVEAEEFRGEIVADMQCYLDDRSEKWQEGDAGEQYQEWINTWEQVDLESVELEPPEYESPDPIDPVEAEADDFAGLPTAADEL